MRRCIGWRACSKSGEDRMYIARRLVRMAIEDIGLADPRALEQAMAAQAVRAFSGHPGRRSGVGAGGDLSGGGAEVRCGVQRAERGNGRIS